MSCCVPEVVWASSEQGAPLQLASDGLLQNMQWLSVHNFDFDYPLYNQIG